MKRKSQQDITNIKTYLYNLPKESWDAFSTIEVLQAMFHMKMWTLYCQLFAIKTRRVDVVIVRYLFRSKQTCLCLICREQINLYNLHLCNYVVSKIIINRWIEIFTNSSFNYTCVRVVLLYNNCLTSMAYIALTLISSLSKVFLNYRNDFQ